MKKIFILLALLYNFIPSLHAVDGCEQRLSREEFREKQKAFITEQARLTPEEAAKFFPLYFELQDRKKKLNDESWKLMSKGEASGVTEEQYAEIIDKVCDNRIKADNLDKSYFNKFKEIVSCKKIYLIQRAETRFHREILRGVNRSRGGHKKQ